MKRIRGQRHHGVALISALLVVALATTAAVALTTSMQLNLRRSANLYLRDQAWQYLVGVEEFAKVLLQQAIQHDKLDLLLGEERMLPVEGGVVSGRIVDLQAGVNLNDLIDDKDKVNPEARARVEALFKARGVDLRRIDALIDWLDVNDRQSGNDGAEDNYYFGLQPPYRAANRQMESLSELYLIREMTPEDVKALTDNAVDGKPVPLLNVIHKEKGRLKTLTAVNINTASEDVLDAIGVVDIKNVVDNRPWKKIPTPKDMGLKGKQKVTGIDVKSEFYLLEATARIGRAKLQSFSIIQVQKSNKMAVVSRSFGAR